MCEITSLTLAASHKAQSRMNVHHAVPGRSAAARVTTWMVQVLSLDLMKAGVELPRVGNPVPLTDSLLGLAWGSLGIATRQSKARSVCKIVCAGDAPCAVLRLSFVLQRHACQVTAHVDRQSRRSSTVQFGILAASLASGEVSLLDPAPIINPRGQPTAVVHTWTPSPGSKARLRLALLHDSPTCTPALCIYRQRT